MRICFVSSNTLNQAWQEKMSDLSGNDVVVFGFNGLGLISYKKELNGQTEYFQDVAKLSKQLNSVVICGCDTDTYGLYRHSAVISDCGKILGVSDTLHTVDESEYVAGGALRVYQTSAGKIGVLVCDDIFFSESVSVLSMCDADIIICLYKQLENEIPLLMMRTHAYCNGVAMALCAKNYSAISDTKGKIVYASSCDIAFFNVKIEKEYRLISFKRRGLYKGLNTEG